MMLAILAVSIAQHAPGAAGFRGASWAVAAEWTVGAVVLTCTAGATAAVCLRRGADLDSTDFTGAVVLLARLVARSPLYILWYTVFAASLFASVLAWASSARTRAKDVE